MATLVFTAIGAQLGGSMLGTAIGAGMGALVGKAVGGTVGRYVDEKLFGSGGSKGSSAKPAEMLRVTTAHHGAPISETYGRNRVAGHVIWSGGFRAEKEGNKYRYFASFALALGQGEIHRFGRVWMQDGEVNLPEGKWRFYQGTKTQEADPLILSIEGEDETPAYRGISYIVFEDIDLTPYYNRIPNFQFEVFRQPKGQGAELSEHIKAVAIIPGSGEHVYATDAIEFDQGQGQSYFANKTRARNKSDYLASLQDLRADMPNCRSASLVVSWFGDDLRVDQCKLTPRVEQTELDGSKPWRVSGIGRFDALTPSYLDGGPVFGGTPDDQSVVQAIHAMQERDLQVMFYPFILMDIPKGNGLPCPLGGAEQPVNPWRGRVTLASQNFSGSSFVKPAIEEFIGKAEIADFRINGQEVLYDGPEEWSYRRFILHYAYLCKLAGGVSEFLIGSELRGLTSIRAEGVCFPFVDALIKLASDVRSVLGDGVKIGYAADWSEYFGTSAQDGNGGFYFHLDKLWADENIDFIGIDNYMPLSDWRHEEEHLDADFQTVYNLEYLESQIAGGEGYDWYYANEKERLEQKRRPIQDGQGEDWIWRYKDIKNWWSNRHFHRPDGKRLSEPTPWVPCSKPIYFTEYGTAAMDLSTNQPNKFLDPKSSESCLAYFSTGAADPFMQVQYVLAHQRHWSKPENNPISPVYHDMMLNFEKSFFWCWDARPWPEFPGHEEKWSDAANYQTGHWLNGRVNSPCLANIIREICAPIGNDNIDLSKLYGQAIGVAFQGDESIREKLESLQRAYQFDVFIKDEKICFVSRGYQKSYLIDETQLIADKENQIWRLSQDGLVSAPARFEVQYVSGEEDYQSEIAISNSLASRFNDCDVYSLGFVLGKVEAANLARLCLTQAQTGRERLGFELSNEQIVQIGDYVRFESLGEQIYLVDHIEMGRSQKIEAFAIEAEKRPVAVANPVLNKGNIPPTMPWVELIDFPVSQEDEIRVYASSQSWSGALALSLQDIEDGEILQRSSQQTPSHMGLTLNELANADAGRRQNSRLEISVATDLLKIRKTKHGLHYVFAIGDGVDWEFIGAEKILSLGEGKYALVDLYRGLFATKCKAHSKRSKLIAIESDHGRFALKDFDAQSRVNLVYGPVQAQGDLIKEIAVASPINASKMPAPIGFDWNGNSMRWLPRHAHDFDYWVEETEPKLRSEIKIFDGDHLLRQEIIDQFAYNLGDLINVQNLNVEIRTISESGHRSEALKETIS